jgi:hypothetical protein
MQSNNLNIVKDINWFQLFCLDQNGGAGLKTCNGRVAEVWETDTVISCGSVSDICANVCARYP